MKRRPILTGLVVLAMLYAISESNGGIIFVTDAGPVPGDQGTVGEYTTAGETINPSLISPLRVPAGIAVSGDSLFVAHALRKSDTAIGEYTTSGATVNGNFIPTSDFVEHIALSGDRLFVPNFFSGTVNEYTTAGETISLALISGLSALEGIAVSGNHVFLSIHGISDSYIFKYTTSGQGMNRPLIRLGFPSYPKSLAVSGDKLFVADGTNGTIREYTTSGALVDPALITGLGFPTDVEVFNGYLFVLDAANGTIGKYTMSGDPLNPTLVQGLNTPIDMAIVANPAVPDRSSTWMLLLLGLTATCSLKHLYRRA